MTSICTELRQNLTHDACVEATRVVPVQNNLMAQSTFPINGSDLA